MPNPVRRVRSSRQNSPFIRDTIYSARIPCSLAGLLRRDTKHFLKVILRVAKDTSRHVTDFTQNSNSRQVTELSRHRPSRSLLGNSHQRIQGPWRLYSIYIQSKLAEFYLLADQNSAVVSLKEQGEKPKSTTPEVIHAGTMITNFDFVSHVDFNGVSYKISILSSRVFKHIPDVV